MARIRSLNKITYIGWRKLVLKRDNYQCQSCGSLEKLEVHHITSCKKNKEGILDINNGIVLCHRCHVETDSYGSKARRKNV